LFGLKFPHPVGLAAGLDKAAVAVPFWSLLGLSHVEVGGVTAGPRDGNPRPRITRLVGEQAVVNSMGLNNVGARDVAFNLLCGRSDAKDAAFLGVNVASASFDPDELERVVWTFHCESPADYFTVNVSCPNVGALPDIDRIRELTRRVRQAAGRKPLFAKLSPDLALADLRSTIDAVRDYVDAIVLTNTSRDLARRRGRAGGLSGAALRNRAEHLTRCAYCYTEGKLPIIGVGGILSADDAYRRIRCGASLLQLCTGLIYQGPGLVREIVHGLARRLRDDDTTLQQAIGVEA
jgi:dihydroorotate dehydrogenase